MIEGDTARRKARSLGGASGLFMRGCWLLLCAALLTAAADDRVPDTRFATLRLSAEVARAGERTRDPVLLIAAARMRAAAGVNGDPRGAEWLSRAETLGGDDPRVMGLIADARAEAMKGRAAGPRVTLARLRAGETHSFAETFRAGQPAVVYVEGDGDTDLSLRVGAACRDVGPGDIKICAWTPARSQQVTVEVGNMGRVENRVVVGIN